MYSRRPLSQLDAAMFVVLGGRRLERAAVFDTFVRCVTRGVLDGACLQRTVAGHGSMAATSAMMDASRVPTWLAFAGQYSDLG